MIPVKHHWKRGPDWTTCTVCDAAYRHPYGKGMPSKEQDDHCWKYFPPAMDRKTNESSFALYVALKRLGGARSGSEVEECARACGFRGGITPWHLVQSGIVEITREWEMKLVESPQ